MFLNLLKEKIIKNKKIKMKKNSFPAEFTQFLDENLLNIKWEEEGEKVNIIINKLLSI